MSFTRGALGDGVVEVARSGPDTTTRRRPVGVAQGLEAVRVELLGGFRVSVGSRVVEEEGWRLRKAGSLIKLLALATQHRLHREQVMYLLWPDLNQKSAANNLRYALHVARRSLEPDPAGSPYLVLRDDLLELCPEGPLRVDVEDFERTASEARRTLDPAVYRAAIDLYAGELLPGDRYEYWAEARREELRGTYLALLIELAGLYEERGEYEPSIEVLRRAVADEPAHEDAHAGLMRLYALSGRRQDALLQYERLRGVLSGELNTEPGPEVRRLYEEIRAGRSPAARPPVSVRSPAEVPPNNLPSARSSFIGRGDELREVKRLLAATRLLTLTGSGGCGKTRLAVEAAREIAPAYRDGAWLVELTDVTDPSLVSHAVAESLGVREKPGQPVIDTLSHHLRSRQLLLVLDNCEHLIEASTSVADTLLNNCPYLKVLATSREALGLAGETGWPVPPLSVPETEDMPPVEELARYEAVRLFVERVRSRAPAFALTSENARPVLEICLKLDGMPLAVELAAARVAALTVEQISEKLADSLGLLTGGSRTAVPHRQTMRATIEWSYQLLDERERKLFRWLSVFTGGWTLEAAEYVGSGGGVNRDDVLDLLGKLVDKSLVITGAADGRELRYRMLEPVRQYGRELLEESGEVEQVRERHAEYFLHLAETGQLELAGARQTMWLGRLRDEHGNLQSAIRWSFRSNRPEMALRLTAAVWRFWDVSGFNERGLEWLEAALARDATRSAARARALTGAGWLATFRGEYDRAVGLLEEGLALFHELGEKSAAALSLTHLGYAALHHGDNERVYALRKEAEKLRQELNDPQAIAYLLLFTGSALLVEADYDRATALLEESLDLYRSLEDLRGMTMCRLTLGMTALERDDDYERAAVLFEEGLPSVRELGDRLGAAYYPLGMGGVAALRGQPARAARLWGGGGDDAGEDRAAAVALRPRPLRL